MKKLFKAIAVLCAVANLGTISASALYVTEVVNDQLRVSPFRYEIDTTENWVAAESTPLTTDTNKIRLVSRDQTYENPAPAYVDEENKELVLPVVTQWPDYQFPLDVQELKQLSKLTQEDFMNCYLGYEVWYEPAKSSTTYDKNSTTTNAFIEPWFFGNYKCNVCGKYVENKQDNGNPAELFDISWSPEVKGEHFTSKGNRANIGVGRAYASTCEWWAPLNTIFEIPCDGEECEGTAELYEAFMRFQPDAIALEREMSDTDFIGDTKYWNATLNEENIGKIHVSDFHFGLNTSPSLNSGEQDILIDDAQVYVNWEDGTYEFKANFINFASNQAYTPRMIIAAYKDGVLKRVQIGGWSVPHMWDPEAIKQNCSELNGVVKNFEGKTVHSGRLVKTDINGDGVVDESDYDFDEVKGFIWNGPDTMTPAHTVTE